MGVQHICTTVFIRNYNQAKKILSRLVEDECKRHDLIVHQGKTMTCQAMLAETWDDVQEWSMAGYIGVEMEAATVFAVSNHFSKPCAAVLAIADNLIQEQSHLSPNTIDSKELRSKVKDLQYEIAVKVLGYESR